MRRVGAQLNIVERYTTDYWRVLASVTTAATALAAAAGHAAPRVVATLVSRHFDFLEGLAKVSHATSSTRH